MPDPLTIEALDFKIQLLSSVVAEIGKDVSHHEQDLYRGDHNMPSLTTRMYNMERVSRALEWIAAASVMTFISVVGWMVSQLIKAWGH